MKVKLDMDSSLIYFVHDNPRLTSRWMIELTEAELADFKDCEDKFFAWQNRFDEEIEKEADHETQMQQ